MARLGFGFGAAGGAVETAGGAGGGGGGATLDIAISSPVSSVIVTWRS